MIFAGGVSCTQCDESPDATDGGPLPTEAISEQAVSEEWEAPLVVGRMGAQVITEAHLVDLAMAMALRRGEPAEVFVREPRVVWTLAQTWLQVEDVLGRADELREDLASDQDEIMRRAAAIGPELAAYLAEEGSTSERIVLPNGHEDRADGVRQALHRLLLAEIWRERWAESASLRVGDEVLREAFDYRRDTATVEYVAVPNIPDGAQLERFVEHPPGAEWFERRYEVEGWRYRRPSSADVRIVRRTLLPGAGEQEFLAAEGALNALRASVISGEMSLDAVILEHSQDPSAEHGGWLRGASPREFPEVFGLEVGDLSPVQRGVSDVHFVRVEAFSPPRDRALDDDLRRELALDYLAESRDLGGPRALAQQLQDAWASTDREAFDGLVTRNALRLQQIGPFRREPDGQLPVLGPIPDLAESLFDLSEESRFLPSPMRVGRNWIVARLVAREVPGDADFERERETFAQAYREDFRRVAWDIYWSERQREEPLEMTVDRTYFDGGKD